MNEDLMGRATYFQVLILNATGRFVEKRLSDWIEAVYIGLSWPDPRIWCNYIGALGGAERTSVVAATAAGILASDSRTYGPGTSIEGVTFIQKALEAKNKGKTAREIVAAECTRHGGKPHFMGYARPIAKGDERIHVMEEFSRKLGFGEGEHFSLALEIEQILSDDFDEVMNFNGYIAAFLSDQGFSPQEVYQLLATLVSSGVTACYVDNLGRLPESFLPQRCDDVDYTGPAPRQVPLREDR
jgi:hypothetical protein